MQRPSRTRFDRTNKVLLGSSALVIAGIPCIAAAAMMQVSWLLLLGFLAVVSGIIGFREWQQARRRNRKRAQQLREKQFAARENTYSPEVYTPQPAVPHNHAHCSIKQPHQCTKQLQ